MEDTCGITMRFYCQTLQKKKKKAPYLGNVMMERITMRDPIENLST